MSMKRNLTIASIIAAMAAMPLAGCAGSSSETANISADSGSDAASTNVGSDKSMDAKAFKKLFDDTAFEKLPGDTASTTQGDGTFSATEACNWVKSMVSGYSYDQTGLDSLVADAQSHGITVNVDTIRAPYDHYQEFTEGSNQMVFTAHTNNASFSVPNPGEWDFVFVVSRGDSVVAPTDTADMTRSALNEALSEQTDAQYLTEIHYTLIQNQDGTATLTCTTPDWWQSQTVVE